MIDLIVSIEQASLLRLLLLLQIGSHCHLRFESKSWSTTPRCLSWVGQVRVWVGASTLSLALRSKWVVLSTHTHCCMLPSVLWLCLALLDGALLNFHQLSRILKFFLVWACNLLHFACILFILFDGHDLNLGLVDAFNIPLYGLSITFFFLLNAWDHYEWGQSLWLVRPILY